MSQRPTKRARAHWALGPEGQRALGCLGDQAPARDIPLAALRDAEIGRASLWAHLVGAVSQSWMSAPCKPPPRCSSLPPCKREARHSCGRPDAAGNHARVAGVPVFRQQNMLLSTQNPSSKIKPIFLRLPIWGHIFRLDSYFYRFFEFLVVGKLKKKILDLKIF